MTAKGTRYFASITEAAQGERELKAQGFDTYRYRLDKDHPFRDFGYTDAVEYSRESEA